jgi:hypothetical protein
MAIFYGIREIRSLTKKPSTSEFIDWLKLLLMEKIQAGTLDEFDLAKATPPHASALIKNEQDMDLLEELKKMKKRY